MALFAILNQYSYIVISIFLGIILFWGLGFLDSLSLILRIGIMVVYVAVAIRLNSRKHYSDLPIEVETVDDVDKVLNNKRATFVMLYSNY